MIPYGRQEITQDDINEVVRVMKSDFLTQGPEIELFEAAFGAVVGAPHAVAVANGTAALHLAMLAARIGPGDRVLVPAVSFVASANCARYVGAEVLFADVEADRLSICPRHAARILTAARAQGTPIRAMVSVDLAGHPADMEALGALKAEFGLTWIQDACHSLGATWTSADGDSWRIGQWPTPDLTAYSFHPVKHITTGEGGMVTTHDPNLASHLRLLRTHGISKNPQDWSYPEEGIDEAAAPNPWYYEMLELGYNFRLTDLQAALGRSQLARLEKMVNRRRDIVAAYRTEFADLKGISMVGETKSVRNSYHLAVARIRFRELGLSRATLMKALFARGIGTQVHYIPIPRMPYYAASGNMNDFPRADVYYREALSLPCYPAMLQENVETVISAFKELLT